MNIKHIEEVDGMLSKEELERFLYQEVRANNYAFKESKKKGQDSVMNLSLGKLLGLQSVAEAIGYDAMAHVRRVTGIE